MGWNEKQSGSQQRMRTMQERLQAIRNRQGGIVPDV
jgi:hypothetical protein